MPIIQLCAAPDLLSLHASDPRRYPYLLQTLSGEGWDILFAFPQQTVLQTIAQHATTPFFPLLENCWRKEAGTNSAEEITVPFRGGWFVYLGYELLHELEPTVPRKSMSGDFPLACLSRIPAAVMVNRTENTAFLFAENGFEDCLGFLQHDIGRVPHFETRQPALRWLEEEDEALFLEGVRGVKRYIAEGDVFQVNLARQWRAELAPSEQLAAELYRSLCGRNPAPFSGIADFGRHQIISSSPERLARISDGWIETRPIAGTHPRAALAEEDEKLRRELLASPKERAEHIMLIDLERNDLGRICVPGSIEVNELMAVRSYAHVHHIESNIRGRLRQGVTPARALRAVFPGGTITGCPKVRTMQIINELEGTPRIAYTGSMGYLNHDGSMDFNILIRSMMLSDNLLSFKAGAGIVADSVPESELAETRAKAKGLLLALEAQ